MSRCKVEQVRCDRCKRVEVYPVLETPKAAPDFKAVLLDKELVYNDICSKCKEILARVWVYLKEWDRMLDQGFLGPTVSNNSAAPVDSAPDYSPPKPHAQKS